MATIRFRINGRFASASTRGAVPYSKGKPLFGAARKAALRSARKKPRRKKPRRKKREKRVVSKITPGTFPSDFTSPFKSFLKPARFVSNRQSAEWFALFRVTFKKYKEAPTRILPVALGTMTGKQARALTREEVMEQASLAEKSGRWFSQIEELIGIYALRRVSERERIARRELPEAKRSAKQRKGKRKPK